jgi:hypothetical protein
MPQASGIGQPDVSARIWEITRLARIERRCADYPHDSVAEHARLPRATLRRMTNRDAVPPWVRDLVRLMDGAFRIPGTDFRIGLDPIIGLFLPGLGDVLGAVPSMLLLTLAARNGVPPVIVLRMLVNIAIDSLIGAVPVLGDIFDATFRSNEQNLALLEAHATPGRKPRASDYIIVGVAVSIVGALALLPLLLVATLLKALLS